MKRGILTGLTLSMMLVAGLAWADVVPPKTQAAPAPQILVPAQPSVTQYDPAKGFPDHNGPFSAMVVVIPQSELSAFTAPAGSARHLDRVARAEAGAKLAIKLLFVGPQADPDGMADVTYDLQVIGPDGKQYGQSSYLGVRALKGKISNVSGLFDNRANVVLMQFEGDDKPGLYVVKAVMHDKVGARDLPLMTGVELLPHAVPAVAAPAPPPAAAPAPTTTTAPAAAPANGLPPVVTMAPIPNADDKASSDTVTTTVKGHRYWHHKKK